MYWDESYRKLKLTPLDEYIHNCVWNRSVAKRIVVPPRVIPQHPAFRAIGASTWMCVCAAWTICDGRDVLLVTTNLPGAEHLMRVVKDYALRLPPWEGPHISVESTKKERVRFSNGACVYGTSILRPNEKFKGVVFDDDGWKERTIRRALGPFAMTQTIKHEEGRYYAYAEDDEPLMELTVQGATDLIKQRQGEILFIGFTQDGTNKDGRNKDGILRPFPSQVIRGAAVFGMAGVTKSTGIKEGLVMDKTNPGKY